MTPISVLVVDDSVVVRRLVSDVLSGDPDIEVVGAASNGKIALAKIPLLNPDIITLDVEMPVMDGLETIKQLRKDYPDLPVIMFSTLTERGAAATFEALERGANDYVTKPANVGSVTASMDAVRAQLIPKIKSWGARKVTPAMAPARTAPPLSVPATRKAAVAAILRDAAGGAELLFIRRAEHPKDPWSGHMGLPGGRVDPDDASPFAAALRETLEEIGLDLSSAARPVGRLSEVRTHLPLGAPPHSVVPFVFALAEAPPLTPNHEVQEALWVPLSFLDDRRNRSSFTWVRAALPLPTPCYRYEGRVIWGLTLRIVEELLALPR